MHITLVNMSELFAVMERWTSLSDVLATGTWAHARLHEMVPHGRLSEGDDFSLQRRSALTTFAVVQQDYGGLASFISNLRSLQWPDFIRSSLNPTQVLASSLGERERYIYTEWSS